MSRDKRHTMYSLAAEMDERFAPQLSDLETGSWLWSAGRRAFPDALAVCLLPTHAYVVAPFEDAESGRQRLNRLIGQFARRFDALGKIGDTAEPEPVTEQYELLQRIQAVAELPRDAGLVDDPLAWPWSTYRDVVGAIADPWVCELRLASHLRAEPAGFAQFFHDSIGPRGFPKPAHAGARYSTDAIACAAAAATRTAVDNIRCEGPARSLFIRLLADFTALCNQDLASMADVSVRTVNRVLNQDREQMMSAGRLCLGDTRLRPPMMKT